MSKIEPDKDENRDGFLPSGLSRREQQIMDALYRLGKATAIEIRDAIPNPPTYTAVRSQLAMLQDKGHIRFERDGAKHIYEPAIPHDKAAKTMMSNIVDTFFGGSVERVVATLIEPDSGKLSSDQLDRISQMIEEAKRQGR